MENTQLDGKQPEARNMDERVMISLVVGQYTRAKANFETASAAFSAACAAVRVALKPRERFITKVNYTYYLVETNEHGDFDITPMDVV